MDLTTKKARYDNKTPSLRRPLVVGFFSVDESGKYYLSTDKLSYLRWSRFSSNRIQLDLTKGENISIRRTDENSNSFYRYLCDHPLMVHKFSSSSLKNAGFICNRQVLRKIANIPYEDRQDETFTAYLYQGNIYLCYIQKEEVSNPRWERCSRWGYKFEQYMLCENPNLEPDTSVPVKEGEEFGCVFESNINSHRLLFAAEMDGIIIDRNDKLTPVPDVKDYTEEAVINELRKRKFLELKTSIHRDNSFNFRKFKSRDIYLQSYFSGVETVVIGFRNPDGIVNNIRRYNTWEMNDIGEEFWKSNICINFFEEFLTFVKKCFLEEISKLPDFKSNDDIKKLEPIELIFERKCGANITLCKNTCDKNRQYLFPWFQEGVSNAKINVENV